MFKKTKVRQILELLHKDLSAREISKTLKVSRNSVAFVKESYDKCDKDWDEICLMNDNEIYQLFYPHTFRPRNRFAPVDYSYVHSELKKVGVTEMLLWEEYCEKCNAQGVSHCCYTTFANGYKRFIADKNYTSHIEHKPGVTLDLMISELMHSKNYLILEQEPLLKGSQNLPSWRHFPSFRFLMK